MMTRVGDQTVIATNSPEVSEIVDRVRSWPRECRVALARRILETLESPRVSTPARTMSLNEVVGLLKTDAPPPDDEQCEQILAEERHGQVTIPETVAGPLQRRAEAAGFKSMQEYVLQLLEEYVSPDDSDLMSYEEWSRKLREFLSQLKPGNPDFDDSRESIYSDR
jgi:hypothetical protein